MRLIYFGLLVFGTVFLSACQSPGPAPQKNAAPEPANISYSFHNMPVAQVIEIYKDLRGERVEMSPEVGFRQSISLETDHKLTKTEAVHLLESALKQQAGVEIARQPNGSLLARRPVN